MDRGDLIRDAHEHMRKTYGDTVVGTSIVWWRMNKPDCYSIGIDLVFAAMVAEAARRDRLAGAAGLGSGGTWDRVDLKSRGIRYVVFPVDGDLNGPLLIVAHVEGAPVAKSIVRWLGRVAARLRKIGDGPIERKDVTDATP